MIVNYINKYKNTLLTFYSKNKTIRLSKKKKENVPNKNLLLSSNNKNDKYSKNFDNYNKTKTKSISNKLNSPLIKSNLIIFERKKIECNNNIRRNYIFENENESRKMNRRKLSNKKSLITNSKLLDTLTIKKNKKNLSNKCLFSSDDYNNINSLSNLHSYQNLHEEIYSFKNNKKYLSPQRKTKRIPVKFASNKNNIQNQENVTKNRFKYYDNQLPYINKCKSKREVKIQKKNILTKSNNNIDFNINNYLTNNHIKINHCNSNISNSSKKNNLLSFNSEKGKKININLINRTTTNFNKEIPINTTNSDIWNSNKIISQSKLGSSLGFGSNNNTKSNFFITSDRRSQDHISTSINNTIIKGKYNAFSAKRYNSINKNRKYSSLKLLNNNNNKKDKPKYQFKNQFKEKLFKVSMTYYKDQFYLNKVRNSSEKNVKNLVNLSNNNSSLFNSSRNSDKLSKYEIKQTLGKGSYAIVKLAINKNTKEKFAIKIYDKSKLNDNYKKRGVFREIQILKHINHPNIVKFIEVINTEKQISIIQELVKGISLREYYNKEIRYQNGISEHKEKLFKKIFKQIFSAINYLHNNHMAHRDIKLENILMNEKYEIKIIDFGFGMYNPENKLQTFFGGTPNYMPPEIILKIPYVGQKADLWSLGVLIYKMYCADFPFRGNNEKELYNSIKNCEYEIVEYVPKYIKFIIKSLIKFNPNERLTCKEILKSSWLID